MLTDTINGKGAHPRPCRVNHRGGYEMNLTLDIDEQIVAKVSKIAAAQDMTVAAMVTEYLTAIANSNAGARLERIARMREAIDRGEGELGSPTRTRDDLYDRPYRFYYGQ